mgnify:CR=1 FL=1
MSRSSATATQGIAPWMGNALVMLLLGWRTIVGGLNAYDSQTTTMMLGFPEWVVYAAMVPPLFLTGLIGLTQAFVGDFQEQDR